MKSKQQKRTEAEQRQAAHDALTRDEKLFKAANRRGNSYREIARLAAR